MKKTISILILGAMPLVALAAGDHAGGHGMHGGHDMKHMEHAHDMQDMSHEADAGQPGDLDEVSRTIEVTMDDSMRFAPDQMKFEAGETVRFAVRNVGKIRHEMVIGSVAELQEHAAMMRTSPAMQHADPNMISLAPGERGELVWQFGNSGTFDFACLVPGHLEAGMTGKIEVE